jgi:myo-inositol-1(or 4)-monophosphatase
VDLEELRDLALSAAEAGASVIRAAAASAAVTVDAEIKGYGDYVTEVDRAAEAAAVAVLRAGAPGVGILAEESAVPGGPPPAGRNWAVDPLDGTTNFIRRFPVVGVSVGLVEDGEPVAACVLAPLIGGGWVGARGRGAYSLDGARLQVRPLQGGGVAATGFPFRRPENLPRYLAAFEKLLAGSEDLRRAGAATLDLAYTAQGSFDGFFELGLSLWDVAAGALLVREAGGVVTDWRGHSNDWIRSGDILAGSPAWHEGALQVIREAVAV